MFDRLKNFFGTNIEWYCDNCGHHMNKQNGFNDRSGVWVCLNCGFSNDVTRNNLNGNKVKEQYNEEVRRYFGQSKNSPCRFDSIITKERFKDLVISSVKGIKRLTNIDVIGSRVDGEVSTVSGIDTWVFSLEFNDYGVISGEYEVTYRGNYDSSVPEAVAKRIKAAIEQEYAIRGIRPPTPLYKPQNPEYYSCGRCGASLGSQHGYNKNCMFWKCKCCGNMNKLPLHYVKDDHFEEDEDGYIYTPYI